MPRIDLFPRGNRRRARITGIALCLGFAAGCTEADAGNPPSELVRELARELKSAPPTTPRLSISPEGAPCSRSLLSAGVRFRRGCASSPKPPRPERIAGIASRISRLTRQRANPDAAHTQALIDLLYTPNVGNSVERSISLLHTAARLSKRPAPVLGDLAAAHLIRAERTHDPRELLAAIEAAEEALEHEPQNRVARFNLALALQWFGLVEEAAQEWRDYLAADSVSRWAQDARGRLRETLAVEAPPPAPDSVAPEAAYAGYAAADPQGGRALGWCRELGAWGEATLAGDVARAEAHLRRAEMLGRVLEQRAGGDATLADGVRSLRASSNRRVVRRLARAHLEFAKGCRLADATDFPAATPRFAAAIAAANGSPALSMWGRVLYGDMVFHSGNAAAGEDTLRKMVAAVEPARYPALAARAHQALAAVLIREDRYVAGLQHARQAAELYARAGERENEGATLDAMALAQFALRAMDEGYSLEHRALERLGPYRGSYRLHNLLNFAARTVQEDGLPRAAARMQNEAVRVAERTGNPVFVAEAHLSRAQLGAERGRLSLALEDVAAGRAAIARIDIPKARAWMHAQLQIAEAVTSLRARPARAAVALDSATTFLMGMHAPLAAFPAVVGEAQALLAAGDVAPATARLEAALGILEQRRDSIRMEPRRAAVFETARTVVDRVVMLKLAAGNDADALRYLERGRASLAPVGPAKGARATRAITVAPGEVALEYALVGDTLLAWTVTRRGVVLFRSTVDTGRLAGNVERLRQQLENRADEAEFRPALSSLYDLLVRPLEARLGGIGVPLLVVADGELAAVPFAALYDTSRRRYLAEDHPLRFAPSLRARRQQAPGGAASEVFVADPAFDRTEHGFERLAEARGEVGAIVRGYPNARVLEDVGANRWALLEALRGARMLHFAGHAVFDDERPERSYLLLAPSPGRGGPATLQAGEIAQLDLRHLSLVVLSACETVQTGQGRAAGFSGLAGAFLAAGAGGAVGSLWKVDDRLTRRFMTEFHLAYRRSSDSAAALRDAQLQMLRSDDAELRSPATWAGFRYLGR